MRTLIVEDDFGSRRFLQQLMSEYGHCDVVVNGVEAVEAFRLAWEDNAPYRLVLMDIMMPEVDGQAALAQIRGIESEIGVQPADQVVAIMTTALEDPKNVVKAYHDGEVAAYLVKPIDRTELVDHLKKLELI